MEKRDSDQNKPPKRSFLYYYGIVMLVLLLLNIFVFPSVMDKTVEGRYDEFLTSLNAGEVAAVSTECPARPDGNYGQGLRSLWHLSRHE